MPASHQLGEMATDLSSIKQAQFIFGGRNYCFYLDGWHGPGFYWCGYAYRRGLGWGGPEAGAVGITAAAEVTSAAVIMVAVVITAVAHGGGGHAGGGHGGGYGGGGHGGGHGYR